MTAQRRRAETGYGCTGGKTSAACDGKEQVQIGPLNLRFIHEMMLSNFVAACCEPNVLGYHVVSNLKGDVEDG
jgi:hypothetical protein